jgi:2-polyprenyl-6-hydroxyphenyl methylase/3-demethylubiquinone-9 3-methyltransferase
MQATTKFIPTFFCFRHSNEQTNDMHAIEKTNPEIYKQINNDLYNADGDIWWQSNTVLHLLKTSVNPWRVGYQVNTLKKLGIDPNGKTALEVGSGGGILTEEIAKMGFITTGIDPADHSLQTASNHAKATGLNIKYDKGTGEALPYADNSFDAVFCCDVLEHVKDLPKVISEISRVLKPKAVFFYDTLNRTFISKLVAIKIWQEWKRWAFMPPHLHVWKMFIKPEELKALLASNNLEWKEHVGSSPNVSIPKMLGYLRKRAKGEWTFADLGKNFSLVESNDMNMLYGGYAIKR